MQSGVLVVGRNKGKIYKYVAESLKINWDLETKSKGD